MIDILKRKLTNLVRGDDGAALVVTLALFMMMYVACAGVFAVGQTVKDKMILQNAADAAAYSAAIVQADTLSRIAVLNREMAWVYKDMVCRQMDYIVAKWLDKTCTRYDVRKTDPKTKTICADSTAAPGTVNLRDVDVRFCDDVRVEVGESGALEFEDEISGHKEKISAMSTAIQALVSELGAREEIVAENVLRANLPDNYSVDCVFSVHHEGPETWSRTMLADDEERFLKFFGGSLSDFGYSDWFPLQSGQLERSFQADIIQFLSKWVWYDHSDFPHPEQLDFKVADELDAEYITGVVATPLVLTQDYFSDAKNNIRKGAISVGVAKYNRNPWARLVQTGADGKKRGLYEMFQPLIGAIDWTWAVASAQAGYLDRDADVTDRAYRADWNAEDQDWNLRTDNFDAVYVPVRQSFEAADFKKWISSAWATLSDSPASDLPDYNPGAMHTPLPSLHNGGATAASLQWDDLRDQIYH